MCVYVCMCVYVHLYYIRMFMIVHVFAVISAALDIFW